MSLEGQQIGRYHILSLLGSGGMGDVYLAEDVRIEQQVAIKVIRAEASPYRDQEASQETTRLFQREARAIVKLDHAHILPLYDYGEERLGNMTIIYFVMPYRKEGSLSDWLRERGQAGLLSPQDVAHLVAQAASALQHAHDRQIIHQDVKPSNFLLRLHQETPTRPDLLLADFGIAKFSTATSAMSHTIRGTPTYMAPEQWEGHPVPATDQYGLAVMTYELLTGRPPFQGGERQVMYQHLMVPPAPPSTVNPHLSSDTDAVLLHALVKQPEQRFASMTAFATAFQQAVQTLADAPTYISALPAPPPTPTPANQGDIRAVLAISRTEAQMGTTRTLTLPGGRRVTVPVPAGMSDGQIMRLDGMGEAASPEGSSGALILSILVKTAEDPLSLSTAGAAAAEATVLTATSETPATTVPTDSNTEQPSTESSTARPEVVTPLRLTGSPTEAATTASQAVFPSSDPALPSNPSIERVDEMTPLTQTEQQADVVPADQPSEPPAPVTTQPPRGISRRKVLVGLAALAVAGGGGLTWLVVSQHPARGTLFYTYRGHSDFVTAVAWSPNDNRIASGSDDGTVQVWDAADGSNPYTYRGYSGLVTAVAWSPDGKRIASGSDDGTVQVWDAADGSNPYTYTGHTNYVYAVAWSPDGNRIASGGRDKTVQVWNAAVGNPYTYKGHTATVAAVAWSPNGNRIASGSDDRTVQVWNAADGSNPYIYTGHSGVVYAVAWSPDGTRIASGAGDNTVQVWNAADGSNINIYAGHSETVYAVAWSPDGNHIASGGDDRTVQVWNAADGSNPYTYTGHTGTVTAVVWSPNGNRIASGNHDKTVQVWQAI